jgi:integrase
MGLHRLVATAAKLAGIDKPVSPHWFRHTFATWAIENEARELDVQYLLGHSTPAMVRRYSLRWNSGRLPAIICG